MGQANQLSGKPDNEAERARPRLRIALSWQAGGGAQGNDDWSSTTDIYMWNLVT